MTQIRAFSKRLKIPVEDVRIGLKCHWKGEMQVDKTYHGLPVGFDLDIEIDSPASFEDQSYGDAHRTDEPLARRHLT